MRRVFPHYKKDYEMACKVMGAMAEEIVRLRQQNEKLAAANVELQTDMADIFEEQNKTIACLHGKIRKARAALEK